MTDALVALQSNWLSDYRNASGIVLVDGIHGPTVTIEDSSRVDPWIVRQALRAAERLPRRAGRLQPAEWERVR